MEPAGDDVVANDLQGNRVDNLEGAEELQAGVGDVVEQDEVPHHCCCLIPNFCVTQSKFTKLIVMTSH